ncbi:hypothetical protein EMIT0P294_50078 [Pseudomonas sp. IT-P294]
MCHRLCGYLCNGLFFKGPALLTMTLKRFTLAMQTFGLTSPLRPEEKLHESVRLQSCNPRATRSCPDDRPGSGGQAQRVRSRPA